MLTNNSPRILCYGDSITRGRIPDGKRFGPTQRRTGVMQIQLGDKFDVIEEGLRGRYTHYESDKIGRNGLSYFYPCILSQLPFDILVLSIGTNNLQHQFADTPEKNVAAIEEYKTSLENACAEFKMPIPKVILVSPPYIDSSLLKQNSICNAQSEETSKILAPYYQEFADKHGWLFFDAAKVVGSGIIDGVHLNEEQNEKLGKELAKYILSL